MTPKMSLTGTVVILAALFGSTQPFFKSSDPKCSLMSYFVALGECSQESLKHLQVSTMFAYQRQSRNSYDQIIDIVEDSCRSGVAETIANCQTMVSKMCGYNFFTLEPERMKEMVEIICDSVPAAPCTKCEKVVTQEKQHYFRELKTCANLGPSFLPCMQRIHYKVGEDNAICTLQDEVKSCIRTVFSKCSEKLRNALDRVYDLIFFKKCSEEVASDADKSCSFHVYFGASATCWAPYLTRLAPSLGKPMTSNGLTKIFGSKDLMDSLHCQEYVDGECEQAVANTVEVRYAVQKLSQAGSDIFSLGACAKVTEMQGCIRGVVSDPSTLCKTFKHARKCYNNMFMGCSAKVQTAMNAVFDVLAPAECSRTKDSVKCAVVEYLAGTGLCWTPIILGLMYQRGESDECHQSKLSQSRRCQQQIDGYCSMRLLDSRKVMTYLKELCDNDKVWSAPMCLFAPLQYMQMGCRGYSTKHSDNEENVCSNIQAKVNCMAEKSEQCPGSVESVTRALGDLLVPETCGAHTHKAWLLGIVSLVYMGIKMAF